ncbi:hypothetical protein SCHPADRAFT_689448 [Schizopora paradoxa]|uniref:Uncharacterized protein n=1 Tax=Schizopora paradoxa TaxID=27342 RepID=A0A0H2R537_9AGAM|nr:hypothetical protein SCHPADRAFT_689448 [Schizopora paradoxa]
MLRSGARGSRSCFALTSVVVATCTCLFILFILLFLDAIGGHDGDIDQSLRVSAAHVELIEVDIANKSTFSVHLTTKSIELRDTDGDGISNALLIALLVLFCAFLGLVVVVLSCCRCRTSLSEMCSCFHVLCHFDSHSWCRRRRQKDEDHEMKPLTSDIEHGASEVEGSNGQ